MLTSEDKSLTLELVHSTGYQLEQDNGQRKYGPPPEWCGAAPRKTEVFVGSLPRDIYEYELVPFFEKVGRIYMLRTMLSFSGFNRGYAFVKYCRAEDAERAIRELNNAEIRPGQRIGVVRSLDNCRLYIGNLPSDRSRDEIRTEISSLTEDVVDVIVHEDHQTGKHCQVDSIESASLIFQPVH
jgi:RNA recognition motif-containing protein